MARGWPVVAERLGLTVAPVWMSCSIAAVAATGAWSEVLDTSHSEHPVGENEVNLSPHSLMLLRRDSV